MHYLGKAQPLIKGSAVSSAVWLLPAQAASKNGQFPAHGVGQGFD